MSVTPIGHQRLNRADLAAIIQKCDALPASACVGACLPVVTDDHELFFAVLNTGDKALRYGFAKQDGLYYVFDRNGRRLVEGRIVDDVLSVLDI